MSKGKVSALNLNDQKTITNARVRFLERAFVCGCWRRLQLDICTKRTPFLVACSENQRSLFFNRLRREPTVTVREARESKSFKSVQIFQISFYSSDLFDLE